MQREKSKMLHQLLRHEEQKRIKGTDKGTRRNYKNPRRLTDKATKRKFKNPTKITNKSTRRQFKIQTKITNKATRRKFKNITNSTTNVLNQNAQNLTKPTQNALKTSSKKFKGVPYFHALVACAVYLQDPSLNYLINSIRNYAKKMLPSTYAESLGFKSMAIGTSALLVTVI